VSGGVDLSMDTTFIDSNSSDTTISLPRAYYKRLKVHVPLTGRFPAIVVEAFVMAAIARTETT
jgi:hypothetical protein